MAVVAAGTEARPGASCEVLIVGAGFGGIAAAIELRRHGIERHHDPREGARSRRDVVLQQLPGRRLRRAEPPLLVLVRAAPRLVAAVLAAAGDPRVPARRRARSRRRSAGRDGHERSPPAAWDERALPLDASRRPGGDGLRGRRAGPRHRPAAPAGDSPDRGRRHRSRATASTRPNGTTATRSRASASAVVGTGASAVQFVPEIAPQVKRLSVFQRTGNWFLPRKNRRYPAAVRTRVRAAFPGCRRCAAGSCSSTASR